MVDGGDNMWRSRAPGHHAHRNTVRQAMDGLWTEARGQQKQSNDTGNNQHGNKWTGWVRNPCRLGRLNVSERGKESEVAQQVGRVATQPLPPDGPQRFRVGAESELAEQVGRVAT